MRWHRFRSVDARQSARLARKVFGKQKELGLWSWLASSARQVPSIIAHRVIRMGSLVTRQTDVPARLWSDLYITDACDVAPKERRRTSRAIP